MDSRGPLPKKCPACGGKISMGRATSFSGQVGWRCTQCNAFSFQRHEHPEITRGKAMARDLEGVHYMDKQITRLPCNVQIGILRARQAAEDKLRRARLTGEAK